MSAHHSRRSKRRTARVSAGCGGINAGQGCALRAAVEYGADGIRYVAVVGVRGHGVHPGARLTPVWEAADPAARSDEEEETDN